MHNGVIGRVFGFKSSGVESGSRFSIVAEQSQLISDGSRKRQALKGNVGVFQVWSAASRQCSTTLTKMAEEVCLQMSLLSPASLLLGCVSRISPHHLKQTCASAAIVMQTVLQRPRCLYFAHFTSRHDVC